MTKKPSPSFFDPKEYARPGKKWQCGHADQGCPCRMGPDSKGRCRATYECQPRLVCKEGETKGRYLCTRPKSYGGSCTEGPLPDGTCCRPIPKCVPKRTLRAKRGLLAINVTILTFALIGGLLVSDWRYQWLSPGEISNVHQFSQVEEVKSAGYHCQVCHEVAKQGMGDWVQAAWQSQNQSLSFSKLLSFHPMQMGKMEQACTNCHEQTAYHQELTRPSPTCWQCHEDHKGEGATLASDDTQCIACHGSTRRMEEAADHAKQVNSPKQGMYQRPLTGYTQVIHAFGQDHPPFQWEQQKPNVDTNLKFDHALHLSKEIPKIKGEPLDCRSCHARTQDGVNFQPVRYEEHCIQCHELQFDPQLPDLHLPHGETQLVRAFVQSLPAQYEDYAIRIKGMHNFDDIKQFVSSQMQRIREQYRSAINIEKRAFFGRDLSKEILEEGKGKVASAPFDGCIMCHEMNTNDPNTAHILPVNQIQNWMPLAQFSHEAHQMMNCQSCHEITTNEEGLQVSLPGVQQCTDCHHPGGADPNQCVTCHTYHRDSPKMPSDSGIQGDKE